MPLQRNPMPPSEIYLVRHAIAAERGDDWPDDSKRPLTERGISRFKESVGGLTELDATIEEITKNFELCAPAAVAAAKRVVNRVADGPLDAHRRFTAELIAQLRASEEGQEGMAAFLEKRKPRWASGS